MSSARDHVRLQLQPCNILINFDLLPCYSLLPLHVDDPMHTTQERPGGRGKITLNSAFARSSLSCSSIRCNRICSRRRACIGNILHWVDPPNSRKHVHINPTVLFHPQSPSAPAMQQAGCASLRGKLTRQPVRHDWERLLCSQDDCQHQSLQCTVVIATKNRTVLTDGVLNPST